MKAKSLLLVCGFLAFSSTLQAGELPAGKAMIWKQPAAAPQHLDLFWGAGSEAQRPHGPFTFEKEDLHGSNPKVWVVDQRGIHWRVKFGSEVHSEVAASRFLWAAGYRTNESYFVPEGVITGATDLKRAGKEIEKDSGRFKNGRFQRTSMGPGVAKVEDLYLYWRWHKNPFVGTRELSGLFFMNVLMANFDTKSDNNTVQSVTFQEGRVENWYMVSDIGGTFGKSDAGIDSRWNLKNYAIEPFVVGLGDSGKSLKLFFEGRNSRELRTIPLEHARWIDGFIGSLSRSQIEDAFRAAYSDVRVSPLPHSEDEAHVQGFADAFEKRLAALHQALQSNEPN